MKRAFAMAICAFAAVASPSAWAQQTNVPKPILQVTLDPPRVVVGQPTTLRIDVLAPNYMTSPPELPGFQVRNAVTRQLQSVNLSEERNGVAFAGVRFEFTIYPQEPGAFAISDQKVKVKYAAEPPAAREELLSLPRVSFDAFIPDAAADLDPYLAARRLTVEQSVQRSSDRLKVGDSITRTVTIQAAETPAMLLPSVTFAAVEGLAVYPAQPSLQDKTEGRTDALTATRTDSATYILQQPGDYVLPAIDVRWWNVGEGRVETAHLDAVTMQVAPNSAVHATGTSALKARLNWTAIVDLIADYWLFALLATLVVAGLIRVAPGVARRIAAYHRRRRQAYEQSEAFAFSRFRHAVRHRDAKTAYFAMLDWLPHVGATKPDHTVEAFKVAACDPVLDRQIDAIEVELFAAHRDAGHWSRHQLLHRVSAARRRLRPRAGRRSNMRLPQQLNPVGPSSTSAHGGRKPAR
ncbi:BatD family protein [Bradyrhizobium sp. RDI18]|uniref:BatD family protein n=1 Tax=Bradyrhizobium sp. RDI18 TaxID=3367400 RepID=UPI003711624E